MNRLLLLAVLLLSVLFAHTQTGYLFVKKGYKKKKIYAEGDRIYLQRSDGNVYTGIITLLMNDTIYLNGEPMPRTSVKAVILINKNRNKFHVDAGTFLLITGGVALTTAGLTLSRQAGFREALAAGATIGYSPLLLKYIGSKISLKRKKFRIGRKFRLQILEFHLPRKRGF